MGGIVAPCLARIPAIWNHEICKVAAAKSARLQGRKSVCYRLSDERDRAVRGVGAVRRELEHVSRYHNRPTHRAPCTHCRQGGRGRASQGRDQRYAGFRRATVGGRYFRRRAHDLRDPGGDEEAAGCRDRWRDCGRHPQERPGHPGPFLSGAEDRRIGPAEPYRMCDECEEFPAQYVAYFNKAGGKLWRPAQKVATTPWAIDIRPPVPVVVREVRHFRCDEPTVQQPAERKAS